MTENDYYVGEFVDGKIHGYGTFAMKTGTYVGYRKNEIKQGFGKYIK